MRSLYVLLFLVFFMTACGKDSHFDDKHLIDAGGGIPSENCSNEALAALIDVTSSCDRDLSNSRVKEICISDTNKYLNEYPNVVCNLKGEVVFTEQFIQEELSPITNQAQQSPEAKTPLEVIIDSGIFAE